MHGANRLGGNSRSDLLVFGRCARRLRGRGTPRNERFCPRIDPDQVAAIARESLAPFDLFDGENPYAIHEDLR